MPAENKRAAVLGWPVSHSLSPRLHNYWLKQYNIAGIYEAIEVLPENLEQTLHALPAQGFAGVNLTIPHKEQALKIVDEIDEIAKRIGAVNTIVIKDKKLVGTNTDAYGFMENLKAEAGPIAAGHAIILGAGGAARAVCIGLLAEGWKITLLNRTEAKAEILRDFLQHKEVKIAAWENREVLLADATLLVNTTSLGMKGQPALDLSLDQLPKTAFVYDIVYAPLMTPLLTLAKARGNPIITGLGMLLYQAQPAFEYWFGVKPAVTKELRAHMLEALA